MLGIFTQSFLQISIQWANIHENPTDSIYIKGFPKLSVLYHHFSYIINEKVEEISGEFYVFDAHLITIVKHDKIFSCS